MSGSSISSAPETPGPPRHTADGARPAFHAPFDTVLVRPGVCARVQAALDTASTAFFTLQDARAAAGEMHVRALDLPLVSRDLHHKAAFQALVQRPDGSGRRKMSCTDLRDSDTRHAARDLVAHLCEADFGTWMNRIARHAGAQDGGPALDFRYGDLFPCHLLCRGVSILYSSAFWETLYLARLDARRATGDPDTARSIARTSRQMRLLGGIFILPPPPSAHAALDQDVAIAHAAESLRTVSRCAHAFPRIVPCPVSLPDPWT